MAAQQLTKPQLKQVVERIILAQGNTYIKELARTHGIKIGSTKKDFSENLSAAIDDGTLTGDKIQVWLDEVEGWGNQHVYLFKAPQISAAETAAKIDRSEHKPLLGQGVSLAFADALQLTAIQVDGERLSMLWQQGKNRWSRFKDKDYVELDGNETFKFEAYLKHGERSVVRFEWRFGDDYCGILIHRNKDIDHNEARASVWRELQVLGLCIAPLALITLSQAVKTKSKGEGTHSSRFDNKEGYVELGSKKVDGGIEEIEAVRQAREGIDDDAFDDTSGMFLFKQEEGKLSDNVSVQVFGKEGRLRLWARCRRSDVYELVSRILKANYD